MKVGQIIVRKFWFQMKITDGANYKHARSKKISIEQSKQNVTTSLYISHLGSESWWTLFFDQCIKAK